MNDLSEISAFLRQQSSPLQGTESAALAIKRVSYSHDAFIDVLIAEPGLSQGRLRPGSGTRNLG